MIQNDFVIRRANIDDAASLLKIYTPFVESEERVLSDVSFEYVAPSVEEFAGRIAAISARYPYLVCELDGEPVGYAYAHPYIERAAYQWGAEMTIYLAPVAQGRGVGRRLYAALEKILRLQNVMTLYSCITASNGHSVMMHKSMDYSVVGEFRNAGFKHGHWLDMLWMEKRLGDYLQKPELFKSIAEIDEEKLDVILRDA